VTATRTCATSTAIGVEHDTTRPRIYADKRGSDPCLSAIIRGLFRNSFQFNKPAEPRDHHSFFTFEPAR
jgi:hypothetical protein